MQLPNEWHRYFTETRTILLPLYEVTTHSNIEMCILLLLLLLLFLSFGREQQNSIAENLFKAHAL